MNYNGRARIEPGQNLPPPLEQLGFTPQAVAQALAENANDPTLRGGVDLWRPRKDTVNDTSEMAFRWQYPARETKE